MSDTNRARRARPGGRASGRFLLRLDPALHGALREAAARAGLSLNEYCARKLSAPGPEPGSPAGPALERASVVLAGDLIGVVAFGSWARGEARTGSDVDLLMVVGSTRRIVRELYRRWDGRPVEWAGRAVEPHFAHLPAAGSRPSGLWAEVAIDGVVLYDPGLTISRRLVELRRDILAGRVVRRRVQGQAYWVELA